MSKHVQKVLKNMAKRNSASSTGDSSSVGSLKNQYEIIRNDLVKLRDDLQKGYDMAKNVVEKKSFLGNLLKSK